MSEQDTHDSDLTLYLICMLVVYGICGAVLIGAGRYLIGAL